jgi:hypothetical protein
MGRRGADPPLRKPPSGTWRLTTPSGRSASASFSTRESSLLDFCYTVIRFLWVSAKFGTCTVVSVNGTLVEAEMCTFTLESTHFVFNKCPIYNHDGASSKFSTNSQGTDYSVATWSEVSGIPRQCPLPLLTDVRIQVVLTGRTPCMMYTCI